MVYHRNDIFMLPCNACILLHEMMEFVYRVYFEAQLIWIVNDIIVSDTISSCCSLDVEQPTWRALGQRQTMRLNWLHTRICTKTGQSDEIMYARLIEKNRLNNQLLSITLVVAVMFIIRLIFVQRSMKDRGWALLFLITYIRSSFTPYRNSNKNSWTQAIFFLTEIKFSMCHKCIIRDINLSYTNCLSISIYSHTVHLSCPFHFWYFTWDLS